MESIGIQIGTCWLLQVHFSMIYIHIQNVNLQNHLESGSLVFIDLLAAFETDHDGFLYGENSLRAVFDRVKEYLPSEAENSSSNLLILDDISSLEWMGVSSSEVQRFARALRALCLKVSFLSFFSLTCHNLIETRV